MHAEALTIKKGGFSFGPATLTFEKGESVCVMGKVGSGKTTLLELLSGINAPDSGKITMDETSATVFQHPENSLFAATVFDDVAYGIRHSVKKDQLKGRVHSALEAAGLSTELETRSPFELSGGEMRKCAIAGALALEPDLLFFDEPLSGMSGSARKDFLDSVTKLVRKGCGVMMVTHDPEAAALADRLIVMEDGKITYDGVPSGVLSSKEISEEHGVPCTFASRVAALIPSIGTALTIDELLDRSGGA